MAGLVFLLILKFICILNLPAVAVRPFPETFSTPKSFSFASYYGNHMVLQQAPMRANVWGYASKTGETITVTVSGMSAVNVTSYIGPIPQTPVWTALLPAVAAGGPYNVTATSSEGSISLTDVLFGDVWICSGQSNMQFTIPMGLNASMELAEVVKYPTIRVFTVGLTTATSEQNDLLKIAEQWSVPSNASVGDGNWTFFSAVCWLYGKYLSDRLGYPIGLLATSYGGTRVEAWSNPDVLHTCHVSEPPGKNDNPNAASVLWNAMVRPLVNMTIYGAIWYQGESNALPPTNGTMNQYNCTFPTMIDSWRQEFSQGSQRQTDSLFPFGFVQLAPYRNDSSITSGFPDIRWHQTADFGSVPNTRMQNVFMAVAMDLPDYTSPFGSIHPRDKQDMAERLGAAALLVAYNYTNMSGINSPTASQITIYEAVGTIVIEYNNRNVTLDVRSTFGFEITCITLDQSKRYSEGDWIPIPMTSHDNVSVTLDYSKICSLAKQQYIASIRYAWRESPCPFKQCAVYNKLSGYPAPPFVVYIIENTIDIKVIR